MVDETPVDHIGSAQLIKAYSLMKETSRFVIDAWDESKERAKVLESQRKLADDFEVFILFTFIIIIIILLFRL
jgi:hypothetical protein